MLSISHLSAGYGSTLALSDVSLDVARGQVAAVIGPNGCGKSTLLRCVAGLLPPRAGTITIEGDSVTGLNPRERARRIALLPQSFAAGTELTATDMVLLGRTPHLSPYGAPSARDHEIVARVLHQVGATELATRRLAEMSGGQRQRIMLARALAQQPHVLLLDEPTSNLDLRYQYEVLDLVRRVARQENLAVVIVLHQINLAAQIADTMLLLRENGITQAGGTPQEVLISMNLSTVYGLELEVKPHPLTGKPHATAHYVFSDDVAKS
jgi:iron complex transport system ATP-binding protein